MRIRKKKHLQERLDKLNGFLYFADNDIMNVLEAVKDKKTFDFEEIFGNSNGVELEIGCGKGQFITTKAKQNPNVNYFAVELLANIIVMAAEQAKNQGLKNVKFFNSGASYLPRYIKEKSIQNIYLNFSPPFPNSRYENRRLTFDTLVNDYKNFLVEGGTVYLKTDDKDFFEYSKSQFIKFGFLTVDKSEEYGQGKIEKTVTEYEQKFTELGLPIYYLEAKSV